MSSEVGVSREQLVTDGEPKYKKQYVAGLVACLAPVCAGLVIGYASPAQLDLRQPGRRFSLTKGEESLFSSLATAGALIGGLIAGPIVDYFGRKLSFMLTCLPYVIGWLCIMYAESVGSLYVGRLVTGICVGLSCLNTSVYLTEIASPKIRGLLGSCFQLFINLGILIAYGVGSIISWSHLAVFAACFPVLFLIVMIPMPESPIWLVRQGKIEEAINSIFWLRGDQYDAQSEVDEVKRQKESETKMSIREFLKPNLLKPLLIMMGQMFVQQFCGINAVVFNASKILQSASSSMKPNAASTTVASVMVIASVFASAFMDKAGRRILLLLSSLFMGVSLFVLGGYDYAQIMKSSSLANASWLPVVCLMIFTFTFNIGLGPIPWLMMSELFPSQARGTASGILTASNWSMAFIVTLTYDTLNDSIHGYGVFWLYGSICILSLIFIWLVVPETKGKSLEEIGVLFVN